MIRLPHRHTASVGLTQDQRYGRLSTEKGCDEAFGKLLDLPPSYLGRTDLALQNLLCANHLPGSEDIDIPKCLTRLDYLTDYVKRTMDRNIHRQKTHPDYQHCEPMWRMASLVTSVKRDFGACYDPVIAAERIARQGSSISDSSKMFINGLLADDPKRRWGTCASIPALITAVARRLYYPVGLAICGRHIYAKWESPGLTFNIEASNLMGVTFPGDDDRREKISKHQIWKSASDNGYYVRTLHPAEELGLFFSIRVECLIDSARYEEAIPAAALSLQLAPDDPQFPHTAHYAIDLALKTRLWRAQPGVKIPPMNEPFFFQVGNLLHPAERAPFFTVDAHYREAKGEIEPARMAYEDACRMRYHGAHEQRDLQRFIGKYGPARRVGPLMPPKNCLRLRTVKCQPHEEAIILRRAADQFMRRGEVMPARDCLHDLYMFDPADAAVFQELRAIESQPGFDEMEKAWNANLKAQFRN